VGDWEWMLVKLEISVLGEEIGFHRSPDFDMVSICTYAFFLRGVRSLMLLGQSVA
jgi:hypothetical protein